MRDHPKFPAYVALAAVCFFWGTTYLGIRMALETFPPLVLVATRYLLSGSILIAAAVARGAHLPRGSELSRTALYGVVTLGVGNGCLAYAEQWIPSGLAALFIVLSPFWLVGIEAAIPGGEPLHWPTVGGMLVGLLGVGFLIGPDILRIGEGGGKTIAGFALLQLGTLGWCLGSILQRRLPTQAHPVVSGAVQQLATGLAYLLPALLVPHAPIQWSARGTGAMLYLVTFGSILGYSAYIYAMDNLPVSVVSIYNYVNPLVAVLLGWMIYREPFGWRESVAVGVIFVGVWLVKRSSPPVQPAETGE